MYRLSAIAFEKIQGFISSKFIDYLFIFFIGIGLGILTLISPVIGLLASLAFVMVVIVLIRPILLGFLIIAGITLTSGMARGKLLPFLIPNEAILIFSIIMALPMILVKQIKTIRIPTLLFIGIVMLGVGTIILPLFAYYFRGVSLSFAEIIKILGPAQYLLLFFLFLYLPKDELECYRLIRWMLLCAGVVAVVGLIQALGFQPLISFLANWYPSSHTAVASDVQRVTSFLGVWNGLGTFMMVNLLTIIAFQDLMKSQVDRLLAFVIFFLCVTCLLASGSYAGLIGLIIGSLLIYYLNRRGLGQIGLVLLVLVMGIILLRPLVLYRYTYQFEGSILPSTLLFRLQVWKDVFWPVIQKNWLWGYRPTLASLAWRYPENNYIALILSGGIITLFGHIGWLSITLIWLYKRVKAMKKIVKSLAILISVLLVVLSIMSITNEVFTFSGTIDYVWIMLGLAARNEGQS